MTRLRSTSLRRGLTSSALAVLRTGVALVGLSLANAAQATTDNSSTPPRSHVGLEEAVDGLRAELRASGVPLEPFERKLREGRAKSVPAEVLSAALRRITDDLTWLHAQLSTCKKRQQTRDVQPVLAVGSDLLLGGVPRDALKDILSAMCQRDSLDESWSRLGELYFYLTGRLQADPASAWRFCAQVARRAEPRLTVDRVVLVLQDIHRQRGSISGALDFAAARSQRGTTMRTIRDELRERYLRR